MSIPSLDRHGSYCMMEQNYLREIQIKLDKNLHELRADDAKNRIRCESISDNDFFIVSRNITLKVPFFQTLPAPCRLKYKQRQ